MTAFAAAYLVVWLAMTLYVLQLAIHQHRTTQSQQSRDRWSRTK
jgi:hypothetical protein